MARGLSTVNVANAMLNWLRGTAPASVAGLFVKLHLGDPGSAGTANASVMTTRRQATMNAASGGSMTLASMSASWTFAATETITDISIHDNVSAGNFLISAQLVTPRNVFSGDTATMVTLTIANAPLAA